MEKRLKIFGMDVVVSDAMNSGEALMMTQQFNPLTQRMELLDAVKVTGLKK
jgi:hypothetical protein